jgi:hypothetical protein
MKPIKMQAFSGFTPGVFTWKRQAAAISFLRFHVETAAGKKAKSKNLC